jgi:hypothetical protein
MRGVDRSAEPASKDLLSRPSSQRLAPAGGYHEPDPRRHYHPTALLKSHQTLLHQANNQAKRQQHGRTSTRVLAHIFVGPANIFQAVVDH